MRQTQWLIVAALAVLHLCLPATAAKAHKPIWAAAATPIEGHCGDVATPAQRIRAPDGISEVEYRCINSDNNQYHLRVRAAHGPWQKLTLNPSSNPDLDLFGSDEVLWTPDSQGFFINGNENGYTNYLLLYHRDTKGWHVYDIAAKAQRDMVRLFPPCKAFNRDDEDCKRIEKDPEFNMVGIAWTRGGRGLIVMGEVVPSSSYGGIMGAVEGYEMDVRSGEILARYSARELKAQWQKAMAWEMRIPEPPAYGPAQKH
ncbi:MAG: hypothetical protein P4L87_16605 [Formivibrio sp.]|nr:hypothetical protein [Formivibrio sp.]